MSHAKIHRKAFLASTLAAGLGFLGLAKSAKAAERTSGAISPESPSSANRVRREPRAVPRRDS